MRVAESASHRLLTAALLRCVFGGRLSSTESTKMSGVIHLVKLTFLLTTFYNLNGELMADKSSATATTSKSVIIADGSDSTAKTDGEWFILYICFFIFGRRCER